MVDDNMLQVKINCAEELLKTSPKFCNQKVERLLYAILDLVVELAKRMIEDKNTEDDLK